MRMKLLSIHKHVNQELKFSVNSFSASDTKLPYYIVAIKFFHTSHRLDRRWQQLQLPAPSAGSSRALRASRPQGLPPHRQSSPEGPGQLRVDATPLAAWPGRHSQVLEPSEATNVPLQRWSRHPGGRRASWAAGAAPPPQSRQCGAPARPFPRRWPMRAAPGAGLNHLLRGASPSPSPGAPAQAQPRRGKPVGSPRLLQEALRPVHLGGWGRAPPPCPPQESPCPWDASSPSAFGSPHSALGARPDSHFRSARWGSERIGDAREQELHVGLILLSRGFFDLSVKILECHGGCL
ncbi:proline-rich proteoglycan 2-like [Motacilla alba alba]|uniref:proline-rich proteoglycan 2-like n=1 Tax=Motacilla alba alba TaxID=1094192 RepID=UPI0018D59CEA|nr:proline-rich proteoglycan 2-like [Motacilla alba alba]